MGLALENVDVLLHEYKGEEAMEQLSRMEKNWEVEWRLAHAMYIRSNSIENVNERRELIKQALELAESSFSKNPSSGSAAREAAILSGSLSELASSSNEQIKIGAVFKKYLNATINLLPEPDMAVLHMRGRFAFKMASLSWIERTYACKLFGNLPACTYEDALKDLLAADKVEETLENTLFIAKSYLGNGDKKKAKEYLTRVIESTPCDTVDEEMIEEAKKKLMKI